MYLSGMKWSVSLPFHPTIDTELSIPLGNRSAFTVVHRSGEMRKRSRPYAAVLLSHVGALMTRSISVFVASMKTPPPFPPSGDRGARQDTNELEEMFSDPGMAVPVSEAATAPPPYAPPVTAQSVNVQSVMLAAPTAVPRVIAKQLPSPAMRLIALNAVDVACSVESAATVSNELDVRDIAEKEQDVMVREPEIASTSEYATFCTSSVIDAWQFSSVSVPDEESNDERPFSASTSGNLIFA
jgi:hypothetical protein